MDNGATLCNAKKKWYSEESTMVFSGALLPGFQDYSSSSYESCLDQFIVFLYSVLEYNIILKRGSYLFAHHGIVVLLGTESTFHTFGY